MRRRNVLTALSVLSACAAIACSDATSGGRRLAHIVLQPEFSKRDAAIYASLERFNLSVTSLRIVLIRPSTDTLADTTVAVAEGQDSIAVEVPVVISGSEENLDAAIEMYSGSVLVFTGTTQVLAKAGVDVVSRTPVVVTTWVGPGAAATSIRIAQADTSLVATAHLALTATAFGTNEAIIDEPQFTAFWRWYVVESDLGTIPLAGGEFVAAGKRGVAHVRVFTPNLLADTVALTLVPPASQVVTVSGDNQSANAGAPLAQPFVVEVRAADNLPVPNTVVRFSAVNGGFVSPDSTMSDAQGRARTSVTLGAATGAQSFRATVAGLAPATINATSIDTRAATSLVVVSGSGQTANVGQPLDLPFVVEVRDQNNQAMAGTTVSFTAVSGNGSVNPATAQTDAQGRAQTAMTLGPSGGAQTFRASVPGLTPVTVTATALIPPGSIKFAGYSGIVDVGATSTFAAIVKAADGSVMDTAAVTYVSRSPGTATVASNGSVAGVAGGQAIIVASVTRNPAITDSMLAVVAPSGGVVLVSSVDRFEYGTNQTITLSVYVDMHASSKRLGSTTIDVAWNPAQLVYQGFAAGTSGVSITPNANNAGNGQFTLAMADVNGFGSRIEMVRLSFTTSTTATSGSFALSAREMTSSDLSTNLLTTLVQVANPLFVH